MKRKKLLLVAVLVALSSMASISVQAIQKSETKAIETAVAKTPALELVPKAAELVKAAKPADRMDVALVVVKAVLTKRPALAVQVVEAIAKVAPETAPAIAGVAAKMVRDQAEQIAKAAARVAPDYSPAIAAAVVSSVPKSAVKVTRAIVSLTPRSAPEIIDAVNASVPAAKSALQNDKALQFAGVLVRESRQSGAQGGTGGFINVINSTITGAAPAPVITDSPEVRTAGLIALLQVIRSGELTGALAADDIGDVYKAVTGKTVELNQDPNVTKQNITDALNAAADVLESLLGVSGLTSGQTSDTATDALNTATEIAQSNLTDAQKATQYQAAGNLVNQMIANNDPDLSAAEKAASLAVFFTSATKILQDAETQGKSAAEIQTQLGDASQIALEVANAYAQ